MMYFRNSNLPKDVIITIFEYNPEHREKMKDVLDELYELNMVHCDNEMCVYGYYERDLFNKNTGCEESLPKWGRNGIYYLKSYFCCENCASYEVWSCNYDIRKLMRGLPNH